jgi:hypothetical protein
MHSPSQQMVELNEFGPINKEIKHFLVREKQKERKEEITN